ALKLAAPKAVKAGSASVMLWAEWDGLQVTTALPCPCAFTQMVNLSGRSAVSKVSTQNAASLSLGAHVCTLFLACGLATRTGMHRRLALQALAGVLEGAVPDRHAPLHSRNGRRTNR